ncbi:PKD domain-containing protein, partial [Candidatus Bathyarchaeota archaeon]|nr:PKD domain-containing protein [Candidatus Bathyarchaeota archaeon]
GIYCNLGIGRLFTVGYTNNHPIPSWNSAIVEWDATCNALSNTTYNITTNDVLRDVWFSSDEMITAGWALNTSTSNKELLVLKWDLSSMQVKRDFILHGTDNDGFKVAFAKNDSHLFIQMRTYTSTIGSFGYPDMMLVKWNIDGFLVVANFSANDTDIFEHGWVEFTFTGSEGDDPVNFQWNFGDAAGNSTERDPVHQYMAPGTYTVTLTVTDADGETDTMVKSMHISVQILLPIADFEPDETTITEGEAVLFTYNGTPGNGIASIDWDFGDGNVTTGGTSISHVYESNGSYNVYINASDIDGDWTDKYKPACITVQNLAPVADFSVDHESITEESSVLFTYNGTIANGIMSYTWDFGDGNVTTGSSTISHYYDDEGLYSVNVTVVDVDGDVSSLLRPGYINVVNVVPIASFTANSTLLLSGSAVGFTFTGDLGLGVETFQWDYGDGITQNLTSGLFGENPVHVYANPGNFTVTLTTWDADNEHSIYELPVQIVVLDGSLDPDGDGLSNELELSHGTDPFDSDSDGDGYLDGAEVDAGSDPMNDSSTPGGNKIPGIMVSLLFSSVLLAIVFLVRKCHYRFQY